MTNMQPVLCPPLEDDDYHNNTNNSSNDDNHTTRTGHANSNNNNNTSTMLLSPALKANFDALKKRKLDNGEAQRVAAETAAMVQSELQRLQNSVAELEAILVARSQPQPQTTTTTTNHGNDNEVGGDEEEGDDDYYDDEEEEDGESVGGNDKILFPALPAVVLVPTDEDDDNLNRTADANHGGEDEEKPNGPETTAEPDSCGIEQESEED